VIKVGILTPTAAINPVTVADQGGLDMLAQTGEYLCLSTQTLTLSRCWPPAGREQHRQRVDVQDLRQGVKFHNGQALTAERRRVHLTSCIPTPRAARTHCPPSAACWPRPA